MTKHKADSRWSRMIFQGAYIWLLGVMLFWFVETLTVLARIPYNWDYKLSRNSLSITKSFALSLRPLEIYYAFSSYCLLGILAGAVLGALVYVLCRGYKAAYDHAEVNSVFISVFLAMSFFGFSGFFLWKRFLYSIPTLGSLLVIFALFVACLALAVGFYMLFTKRFSTHLGGMFVAVSLSLYILIFGETHINEVAQGKFSSVIGSFFALVGVVVLFLLASRERITRVIDHILSVKLRRWIVLVVVVLMVGSVAPRGIYFFISKWGELEPTTGRRKPNVVLIVMDTTRSDRFSCYGYSRPTTPHIDQIAGEGVLFENVIAPSSWTLPSHASLFTGLFLSEHGASDEYSFLESDFLCIAELLRKEGYRTMAYSNNPLVSRYKGLDQGFETFQEGWKRLNDRFVIIAMMRSVYDRVLDVKYPVRKTPDQGAAKTTLYVKDWLKKHSHFPFFIFINYMEPHLPYDPPPPYDVLFLPDGVDRREAKKVSPRHKDIPTLGLLQRERGPREVAIINALYDGEIRYLEEKIWEVYKALQEEGVLDNTLFIVTSDHGENLGDHELVGHAFGLYNTLLSVPLIIRFPKQFEPGVRVNRRVQLTDVFATILDVVGIDSKEGGHTSGGSLLERMRWGYFAPFAIAERNRPTNVIKRARSNGIDASHLDQRQKAIYLGNFKYIWSSKGQEELYNIAEDMEEAKNLVAEFPDTTKALRNHLASWTNALKSVVVTRRQRAIEMDAETKERLRSLGYVE